MRQDKPLRADARRNLERVSAAAADVFRERGLDAPLEEIAKRAGVSPGTIYHRFGTREALIDQVMTDLIAERMAAAQRAATANPDPWAAFAGYVEALCALQAGDQAAGDAVSRRYADAERLTELCDAQTVFAAGLIAAAHADGSLRDDFTADDFPLILWTSAAVVRATAALAPDLWRRWLALLLDGLRAGAANPLPVPGMTHDQVREAMLTLGRRAGR
jgi:AcrR family transcriptional regulator